MIQSKAISYTIEAEQNGKTVKQVLKGRFGFSARLFTKLKQAGGVYINQKKAQYHTLVKEGDSLVVRFPEETSDFTPQNIPLEIVYEDEYLLIINKEPNMVVHPTKSHAFGTLSNALMYYYKEKGEVHKIRFINRLDRDTSGLILVAKNSYIQQNISQQMIDNKVVKKYKALVEGVMENEVETIDLPIGQKVKDAIKREVFPGGAPSITHYKVEEQLEGMALLDITLETGRTHQIRVHLEAIGHPIVGDTLYGQASEGINRQALHAYSLTFKHPILGKELVISIPLPKDMENLIKA